MVLTGWGTLKLIIIHSSDEQYSSTSQINILARYPGVRRRFRATAGMASEARPSAKPVRIL
eukprot:3017269-Pleurochrysis_carterae.AAC.4